MQDRDDVCRSVLHFRHVNIPGNPDYNPALQKHHILPCAVMVDGVFGPFLESIGFNRRAFSDFRKNGILLPCLEQGAWQLGLPLHRGPHPNYNTLVCERLSMVEASWAKERRSNLAAARIHALYRIDLIQRALRRLLLSRRMRNSLNRKDPNYTSAPVSSPPIIELDMFADHMWAEMEGELAAQLSGKPAIPNLFRPTG
ncbi:AHH domain-containing protein [Altericroceibacterium endophyticum]|uniref:Uncharacterized protein n=1 Tax=Altericroceibacterium endophyticum TaxID=1808508 RepID=A0A6I4T177_9SPHN|nr:AHH domain-containing protein [Altericroceibacterium endophyticum]MXO64628.1 hypothetical protein [Altericroceibacterium endophyticum]